MKMHKALVQHKDRATIDQVAARFAVGVNDAVVAAMDSTDPTIDPVARQYIPSAEELARAQYERDDPIGDDIYSPVRGIVHRYPDRVLFKVTSVCPVYCRYCFRKMQVGPTGDALKKSEFQAAFDYIAAQESVREVILTGGDPLMLSPARLHTVFAGLEAIDHVRSIRVNTRAVAADPARVSAALLDVLKGSRKNLALVMHINHAQEITNDVARAISELRSAGVMMLSQSVLLRGVNDSVAALQDLFYGLFERGVKPYMLYHLDPAPGTDHFRVPLQDGQALMRALRGHMSGLCLPEYMLDIPGGYGKVPLTPSYVREASQGGYEVTDYQGGTHHYE